MLLDANKTPGKSKTFLRKALIVVIVSLIFGLLIDLFSGFYVLRHSKNIYVGLVGLIILAIFALIGEAGSDWIGSRDDVRHPLYKRAFHLLALLLFGGFMLVVLWLTLKYLGVLQN